MEKHFITGNTYAVKDQLKELGCQYDPEAKAWFHPDKAVAEKAQALVSPEPERYPIGSAPKELSATLREMGAKHDDKGWYHTDGRIAEAARQKILEVEPRHYLTGNSLTVKEQLKKLGCRWDADKQQWYAPTSEIAEQAQHIIDTGGKHFIPNVPYGLNKAMRAIGCCWDFKTKCWYHTDSEKANEAERLIQEHAKQRGSSVAQAVVKEISHEM